jgi:hypothetical protein
MSQWIDRILKEFTPDLSRLWITADPDHVLLDGHILSELRSRGFEILPYEDSVVFRAEFEDRYRSAWDKEESGPFSSLVIHLRGSNVNELPWDYLRQARKVSLSLADLFPKLSYSVVRQMEAEYLERLFDAQNKHVTQPLGETSTKDFILTHIFQFSPHVISSSSDLWRELLRLRNREVILPSVLADRAEDILTDRAEFGSLPIKDLLLSKSAMLRLVQSAWVRYLIRCGAVLPEREQVTNSDNTTDFDIPFDHPDVRVNIESMFLDGTLHPQTVRELPTGFPIWARIGVMKDPDEQRNLLAKSIDGIEANLPTRSSGHRDWTQLARRLGELIAKFDLLDISRAESIKPSIQRLKRTADDQLRDWIANHYADLPSLPAIKGPVMVHHVPRFLAMRRDSGEAKIALVVFDGMAIDQWTLIRDVLTEQKRDFIFEESACFAWLPTTTSVSRQALFSGLKPREFSDSIDTTAQDSLHWSRFWQDQGLRASEVVYRKGLRRKDQLVDLSTSLDGPMIKIAGIVVNTIDDFVHGAFLGKRAIANQIIDWVKSGFVEELFTLLLDRAFKVYVTADHGNLEAIGKGRPNQGVAPELKGERVRIYGNEALAESSCDSTQNAFRLSVSGLPMNFFPMYAAGDTAFVASGEQIVAHGGMSVHELIVPFIQISCLSDHQ